MKRTAEQAVRDELAVARTKLEADEKTLDRVQLTVKAALAKRTEAADVVERAKARVKRAQAALDALLADQLPLGAPTDDTGTDPTTGDEPAWIAPDPSDASSSDGTAPDEGTVAGTIVPEAEIERPVAETLTDRLVSAANAGKPSDKLGPDSGPELVRPKSQEGRRE